MYYKRARFPEIALAGAYSGYRRYIMKYNISHWRVWLFRGLVAAAAGLMMVSFIMPWWTANLDVVAEFKDPIRIYGHGLQHDLVDLREYIIQDETPFYQTVLAWVFVAVSAGLILLSSWLKGRKGSWLLGGIGLIFISYTAIAVFVVINTCLKCFFVD